MRGINIETAGMMTVLVVAALSHAIHAASVGTPFTTCNLVDSSAAWSMTLAFGSSATCQQFASTFTVSTVPGVTIHGYPQCGQNTYCLAGPNTTGWTILSPAQVSMAFVFWTYVTPGAVPAAPPFDFYCYVNGNGFPANLPGCSSDGNSIYGTCGQLHMDGRDPIRSISYLIG